MGKYIGYANGGSYGYRTPSGYTGGEDAGNHYFAGVYGTTSTYYSIVHFPAINEVNKNLVIQNAKVRIKSNSGGPCSTAQVWVTSSSDKYSTEGVLAASGKTITISTSAFTTIDLSSAACNKIAEYHSQGKPFYLRFTSTATERYRFVGYNNYAYSDVDHNGAPMLEFDYNYGSSTGTLSSSSITLGNSISLTVKSLSTSYTHTIEWYLNNQKVGSTQNQTGSGSPGNFSYPTSLATSAYFSPTSNISQGKVVLTTKWNNTAIGTATYYFNVNIGNNALPTMSQPSFTFQDRGSTNRGYCLQNFSSVYCTASASGSAGASIQKIQVVVTGAASGNFSFSSNLSNRKLDISLSNAGKVTVTVTATDSRGKTSSNNNSFTVESYFPPSITSMNFYRCNASGTATTEGTYIRGTADFNYSTTRSNTVNFSERKIDNTNLTNSNMSLNTTTKKITLSTYQITSSLATIKFTIRDNFGSEVSKEFSVSGVNYLMHFRDGAIGIGSPASNDKALTIGFPVYFNGGIANLGDPPSGTSYSTILQKLNGVSKNGDSIKNLTIQKTSYVNSSGVTMKNETGDLSFERPDDPSCEQDAHIDILNNGLRIYSYNRAGAMTTPLILYLGTGHLWVNSLQLSDPLPIKYGGTGATSKEQILSSLGTKQIQYNASTSVNSIPVVNGTVLLVPVS